MLTVSFYCQLECIFSKGSVRSKISVTSFRQACIREKRGCTLSHCQDKTNDRTVVRRKRLIGISRYANANDASFREHVSLRLVPVAH
jgi:hypothetical protein